MAGTVPVVCDRSYLFFYVLQLLLELLQVGIGVITTAVVHQRSIGTFDRRVNAASVVLIDG